MAVNTYRYYDDGGRTYQLALPDDFALALSYEAASPSDAYLPPPILPRYATFISADALLIREVVIPSRGLFASPPQTVSADGRDWKLASLYGERFALLPYGNVQVIAGPQGPPGDAGAADLETFYQVRSSPLSITAADTVFNAISIADVPAGTWLADAVVTFKTGASAALVAAYIDGTDGTPPAAGSYMGTASRWFSVAISGRLELTQVRTVVLRVLSSVTNTIVDSAISDPVGLPSHNATYLRLVKVGAP